MKNTNLKIRPIYKTLALGALLALVGCKRSQEHKNVVMFVEDMNSFTSVYIRDVDTGVERVYQDCGPLHNGYNYLTAGDTVVIKTGPKETVYDTRKVLNRKQVIFLCNNDTIRARQGRAINRMLNQKFGKQK